MTSKKLLVVINGEPITLPRRHSMLVGSAVLRAFARSKQTYLPPANYRIETKDHDLLHPKDRVEYLEQIHVWVDI